MQGQLSSLYYQYYRFALDTARKAEPTMKWELMRPELDATTYIQPNYWDSGHQGLLSGEALYLDLKRMELDYHDLQPARARADPPRLAAPARSARPADAEDHRKLHGHDPRVALRPRLPRPLPAADQDRRGVDPVRRRALHERQLHADAAEQLDPRLARRRTAATRATRATRRSALRRLLRHRRSRS